ncbi:hypothetical protein IGS61_04630 [Janthinobacterium sp. FW305-129]|uniref:hypothetical protein n=1 Tax=Janthinobacterium sp. FW305-129 TaxID=2775054 RepID=UPI001E29F3BA|nr:hypothetical protein [Janthinobacterium sp. FW305-129]MCC7596759.1 hypothetical protein [Janthinobacterium sp. FW305-129]
MNPSNRKQGSYKSSMSEKTAPYTQAVQAVQQVIAAVRQKKAVQKHEAVEKTTGAPAPMIEVIIDETFYLLHEGALYSGMGEEAVSAAFAASLAAASEMWPRLWVWPQDEADVRILYQHYSDKEETVLGADFSLIFVDHEEGATVYRVIVAQAKRLTAAAPKTVNIRRKAFSQKKQETREDGGSDDRGDVPAASGENETGGWEDAATMRLESALADGAPEEADLAHEAENYQLSRLLNLQKQVRPKAYTEFVYVMWPAKPKNQEVNTVLFEKLAVVATYFNKEGKKKHSQNQGVKTSKERYPVSFPLEKQQSFRDFLLNYKKITSISEIELTSILPAIREESTATILLNASGQPLSLALVKELHIDAKPPYKPATGNTKSHAPIAGS